MIRYGEKETQYLLDHRYDLSSKTIAANVSVMFGTNRDYHSISQRLARIGKAKQRVGGYSEGECLLIETFIGNPDTDELLRQLKDKFGTSHSRDSVMMKKSKLKRRLKQSNNWKIMKDRDGITATPPAHKIKTGPAVISTRQLMHAMSHAERSVQSLALELELGEVQINDMLIHTGVSKEYAPRIRAALGMKE